MGRKKTYDRDDVLVKAMELFWKAGIEGAHLSKIVEVTGLNRFSLYKEFGGKVGLFEEALALYLQTGRDVYDKWLNRSPHGLANIRAYFMAIHYAPDYHGCFMVNTLTERYVVSDNAFHLSKVFTEEAEALYLKNVQAAIASGELPSSTDAVVMAKLLASFDLGLAISGIADPSNENKDKVVESMLDGLFGSRG